MHFVRSIAIVATSLLTVSYVTTATAEPKGKGIVGGTLLGAEAVLLTEAAFDVSPNWLYYVGGGVGAVGGGIGGYFLEDQLSSKSGMALLAAGLLIAIPTTVAVLSATAYEPKVAATQDTVPTDEPQAEPVIAPAGTDTNQTPSTTAPTPAATPAPVTSQSTAKPRRRALAPVLVAMDDHANLHLGLPAVEVRDTYSRAEMQRFGLQQHSELRVPLLRVAF